MQRGAKSGTDSKVELVVNLSLEYKINESDLLQLIKSQEEIQVYESTTCSM